jgi:NADH-quinone oxidoreductase subunit K
MEIKWYIFLSMALFCMLNSVNLLLIAFSKMHMSGINAFSGQMATSAQIFVFFIMIVAAAEVSVGLAIIVMMYRNTHSIDINFLNRLKN